MTTVAQPDVPIDSFPAADYEPTLDGGPIASNPVALPVTLEKLAVTVDKSALPDTDQHLMVCRIELSLDGGVTWSPNPKGEKVWPWGIYPIEFAVSGLTISDDFGKVPEASVIAPMPDKTNPLRQIRTLLTPLQPVNTKVSVTVK